MNTPIYNPILPFNMTINISQGLIVHINGVPNGNRFNVNFKTSPQTGSNIAFQFNPRFDDGNTVVRNTKRGGRWEAEERQSNGFPFMRGQAFELTFLIQAHQFKVAVNGRHFIEYAHRVPYQHIQILTIEGAVKVNQIRFEQEAAPVNAFQMLAGRKEVTRMTSTPTVISNPAIPYNATVPFNNIKNRKVVISGIPENRHPYKFMIDFKANSNTFFHFNPRINENVIVRNTQMRGSWGAEERQLGIPFPFQYGVPYQLTFIVDQHAFRVELNGTPVCTYNHRQRPLNLIRQVSISGSTSVSRIAFE